MFKDYFDATTGPKNEHHSYQKISATLEILETELLFLSDSLSELDAAKKAGFQTCWVKRDDKIKKTNKITENSRHIEIQSFTEIILP